MQFKGYAFIKDLVSVFISSCGIVLLLIFFSTNIEPTRNEIRVYVLSVYLVIFTLIIFKELICYKLEDYSRWFEKENSFRDTTSIPVAAKKQIMEKAVEITRIHEAGHALMCCLMQITWFEVDISGMPPCVRRTMEIVDVDDVKKNILISYAGAAAEEIVTKKHYPGSMGAEDSDFEMANVMLKTYVMLSNPEYSKTGLDYGIQEQMITVSKRMYRETLKLLEDNREKLDKIIAALKEKSVFTDDEIKKLIEVE